MATSFDFNQSDDQLFSFEDVSPTSSYFTDPFGPSSSQPNQSQANQGYLNVPTNTMADPADPFVQYLSRPPSLSPSSQHLNPSSHSPSSASPSSNFSFSLNGSTSGTDEMLFNNSFSSSELDALFFQTDQKPQQKIDQPFFLPQQTVFPAINGTDNGLSGMSREDAMAMLNLLDANVLANNMNGGIKAPQLAQQSMPQTIRPQWMSQAQQHPGQYQVNGESSYPALLTTQAPRTPHHTPSQHLSSPPSDPSKRPPNHSFLHATLSPLRSVVSRTKVQL